MLSKRSGKDLQTATSTRSSEHSASSEDDLHHRRRSKNNNKRRGSSATLTPQRRSTNSLEGLTIDKLNIASLGLHGRDQEVDTLNKCLDQLVSGTVQRQLILISGYSGTGKTALATTLQKKVEKQQHNKNINNGVGGGLFVKGKFDQHLNEPYSGIASACGHICGHILVLKAHNPTLFEQIHEQIQQDLGSELSLLVQVIPVLGEVIEYAAAAEEKTTTTTTPTSVTSADAKNQFQFAFQRFIRIISTRFAPLVLVLDDLQWADGSSLDLLDSLISDQGNSSGIMVIGIYRSNEVREETHVLQRAMKDFRSKSLEERFLMTEIPIGNLDIAVVDKVIQELLSMEGNARTIGLAEVCFQKTKGNAFFLMQLLRVLHENGLLMYNFGTLSWSWDVEEIEESIKASANVVEMLQETMTEEPDHLVEMLQMSACLGSTFETKHLKLVWEALTSWRPPATAQDAGEKDDDDDHKGAALIAGLDSLEQEGYIKKVLGSHENYSWTHDNIQEAALSLIPKEADLGGKIGSILLAYLDEDELNHAIFVVADLLNTGNSKEQSGDDKKERLKLAHLNYEAAQKAVSLSAFESAAEYASQGIELIPKEERWTDHYPLALDLYSVAAQAQGCLGHVEEMETYCQEVFSQTDRPMEDKFRIYHTWLDSIQNHSRPDEAMEMLLSILKQFKCRFPKKQVPIALGIIGGLMRIKRETKSRLSNDMCEMTDPTRIELMKFLDKLSTCMYYVKDNRMPLVIFRILDWTKTYGFCVFSPVSYAGTGLMFTGVLNDLHSGTRWGEQALRLLDKCQSLSFASRTMFIVNAFIFPWTKPWRQLLNPLMQAYDIGLKTGDSENGMWSIFWWLMLKYMTGTPLEALEADFRLYGNQMKDLKRDLHFSVCNCMRQLLLNLMGQSGEEGPAEVVGDACSQEQLDEYLKDPFLFPAIVCSQGVALTYFGEHVRHAKVTADVGHDYFQKKHLATPSIMFDTLLKGVSCFAAARETGEARYARLGEKMRSKMKKWLTMGNVNVMHYESFLDAEQAAFKGRAFEAVKHYQMTILMAARNGFQHDAAFASERLAEFQMNVMNDTEEATFRANQAIQYWKGWGALGKVEHVQDSFWRILEKPADVVAFLQPQELGA